MCIFIVERIWLTLQKCYLFFTAKCRQLVHFDGRKIFKMLYSSVTGAQDVWCQPFHAKRISLFDWHEGSRHPHVYILYSVIWKQHMPRVLDEVWWAVAHKRLIKCWVTGTLIVYLLIDVCRKLLHCSFKYSIFFINYLKWNLSGMNLCLCEFEQHGCVCDETFLPSACRQYISYPNITHILDHL